MSAASDRLLRTQYGFERNGHCRLQHGRDLYRHALPIGLWAIRCCGFRVAPLLAQMETTWPDRKKAPPMGGASKVGRCAMRRASFARMRREDRRTTPDS
jgi:hypothetical protein